MKHYDETQLNDFIENRINDVKIKTEIELHLKECVTCFNSYIDLKETIYFMTKGEDMPAHILEKIISLGKREPKKKLSLIIYYTKKTLKLFSEDNFELKSRFIDVAYSYRGEEQKEINDDGVILFKTMGDYKVTLNLFRLPDKEYFYLSVDVKYKEKAVSDVSTALFENDMEIEKIELDKKNQFQSELQSNNYEIFFQKDNEELFSVSLKLQEDK
jgi:hypothetical protein